MGSTSFAGTRIASGKSTTNIGLGLLAGLLMYFMLFYFRGSPYHPPAVSSAPPAFVSNHARPPVCVSKQNSTLEELYLSKALATVDVVGFGNVYETLQSASDSAHASNDFQVRRQSLARSGLGPDDLALEVSPLKAPLLHQGNSTYNIDVRTKDELVRYYDILAEDAAAIAHIHFKWSGEPYIDIVGNLRFKRVVASHVIEHVPDLLTWLNSIHDVLEPQGQVRLFIPDMRFMFDFLRPATSIFDIIGAKFEGHKRPTYATILEHMYYASLATHKHVAHENWKRPALDKNIVDEEYDESLLASLAKHGDSHFTGASYIDGHVWKWTPQSFTNQLNMLTRIGLLKLRLDVVVPTSPVDRPGIHRTEFFAIFVRDK